MSAPIFFLVCLVVAACGPPPQEVVELVPGDALFDVLSQAELEAYPGTNLSVAVAEAVRDMGAPVLVAIPADAWRALGPADANKRRTARALGVKGKLLHWSAGPDAVPKPRGWALALRHDGRELGPRLERMRTLDFEKRMWLDAPRKVAFLWDAATRRLSAFAVSAPGSVEMTFGLVPGLDVRRYECRPEQAVDTERRIMLGDENRRALLLPAPAALALSVEAVRGDALLVAVGVIDQAFREEDGALRAAPGGSDGVTFAVDAEREDGSTQRLWSRHVVPGEGFVEDRVDLGALGPESFELRLVSEPGPDGDADFDYAAWADLRVAGPPDRAPQRPHVVLVDVDTLRADRLGCYGSERDTSPRIDAWAARAMIYVDATSTASWTLPSTASILTGLAVHQHGVSSTKQAISPQLQPLATRLREVGYDTFAITDGAYVGPAFGFGTGFDVFKVRRGALASKQDPDWDEAIAWIADRASEQPFFLFLQTYMVHSPYVDAGRFPEPHPEATGWLSAAAVDTHNVITPFLDGGLELDARERDTIERMYDEGVARADEIVGDFLDELERVLGDEPCLVVLLSDHGEEFFEHEGLGHGHSLHRELLHVPLIVRFPGGGPVGRSSAPVSTLDIVPTVLDVVGLPLPDVLPGRSLRARGEHRSVRLARGRDDVHALESQGDKLVHPGPPLGDDPPEARLYRAVDDPWEQHDLSAREGGRVTELTRELEALLRRYPPIEAHSTAAELDDEVLDDLRALGYLAEDG